MREMEVVFPGGRKVDVLYQGFRIETDQSREDGSPGSAPKPFDLFLASIAACSGIYVLVFCLNRDLNTEGLKLIMRTHRDPAKRMIGRIEIEILLPPDFPDKYREAVIRAAEQCTVKKHMENPPEFVITTKKPGE